MLSKKNLFGKEADKLERANDDEKTFYIIEKGSWVHQSSLYDD